MAPALEEAHVKRELDAAFAAQLDCLHPPEVANGSLSEPFARGLSKSQRTSKPPSDHRKPYSFHARAALMRASASGILCITTSTSRRKTR
jgi:hypothetical protein